MKNMNISALLFSKISTGLSPFVPDKVLKDKGLCCYQHHSGAPLISSIVKG